MKKNKRLETCLGYSFSQESLLLMALSHRSVGKDNNERLEFLGDSLLSLIITEALFSKFPLAKEGDLSRLRSSLVKGETLAEIGKEFDLGEHLLLGGGELKSGGFRRASILADTVEAIIGAIYLDADLSVCREKVLAWFKSRLDTITLDNTDKDAKTRLQEFLQEQHQPLPIYTVVETLGEAHSMEFVVECHLVKKNKTCTASASSKRTAEKKAAGKMLNILGLNAV